MEERSKNKKVLSCCFCGGDMSKGKTTYTVNRRGYHLLIDDVPAWKCTQCGEAYYEGSEVEAIQEMLREVDAGAAKVRKEAVRPVTV